MKAKRRHELKENQLAKVITSAPTFWEEWGGRFLAGAVAALVVVVLINYRTKSNREGAADAMANLATARTDIEDLQQLAMATAYYPPQESAIRRRQLFTDANNAIGDAIHRSDDHKLQAEALVARGDLFWTLAMLPAIPGSATQPSFVIKDPKELTASAAEAYQTAINNFADERYASIAARFGLGAIAENKGDFDAAKTQYEKLALETKDWPAYQKLASDRLSALEQIRVRVQLAPATTLPDIPPPPTGLSAIPPLLQPPATTKAAAATQAAIVPAAPITAAPLPGAPASSAPTSSTPASSAPATQPR